MRVNAILYGTVALAAALSQAAPIAHSQEQSLVVRAAAPKVGGSTSGGGLLSGLKGLFGGGKAAPKPTPAAPVKETPPPPKDTPAPKTTPAATTTPAPTTKATTTSATTTSASSSAEPEESAPSCPLYLAPDAIHLSTRDLEARAGEEYWFRFEDPNTLKAGILPLAARNGGKDFDDQAYKWISTDAGKVLRGSIGKGRQPTVFVLPAGTRDSVLAAAKDFDTSRDAQEAQDFVTKDNEPGDVGINGVKPAADGKLPLDTFRSKVIRTVTVKNNKGKLAFQTVKDGKVSNTASKPDQASLRGFCG